MEEEVACSQQQQVSSIVDVLSEVVRLVGKAVSDASDVSEVIGALQALASLLYPYQLTSGAGRWGKEITENVSLCLEKASQVWLTGDWRELLKSTLYESNLFPIIAKILLFSVAPDWLACFSSREQIDLFDTFFKLAPPSVALTSLVYALAPSYVEGEDGMPAETSVTSNVAERLLVLCLFENDGLRKLVAEFAKRSKEGGDPIRITQSIVVLAQSIASIPDKARPHASRALLSPQFHISVSVQLVEAAEEHWRSNFQSADLNKMPFIFVAELLTRFSRRGHADLVASQMLFKLLSSSKNSETVDQGGQDVNALSKSYDSNPPSNYWTAVMYCIKDMYAMERLIVALLLEMADKQVTDQEAYHILSSLFGELFARQMNIRSLFTKKLLLSAVLPIRCLRWVLQFGIFRCSPEEPAVRISMDKSQTDIIHHLLEVWAEQQFIQSSQMQKHSYVTTALCLSLRAMTKQDLEHSGNFLPLLLQGISRRLESPLPLVRVLAKKVALAFSLVIDEANPLLLDEGDKIEDLCDWEEFNLDKPTAVVTESLATTFGKEEGLDKKPNLKKGFDVKKQTKPLDPAGRGPEGYDPDEVVDLQMYALDSISDDESMSSDVESTCSLEPYDLSDDESDLERCKFPKQLKDCAANLRKGDEPELVEKTLQVIEKLIRAMPEELENVAPDLVHALIHARCSDVAVEGQEETAEKQRYDSLVALLACAPMAVEVCTGALYSPHVDVSQRLLILDVMSDAAIEIAVSQSSLEGLSVVGQGGQQIMEIDKSWYGPGGTWAPVGAGPWKEIVEPFGMVSLSHKYEREIPQRQDGSRALGTSRRWGQRSMQLQKEQHDQGRRAHAKKNNFVAYAPSFMLPVMRDFDKQQHGVDLVGRDFIVLGRLICMLGVCMESLSLQPEACILAVALLSMLRSKQISSHSEPYVRRASLYAVSRVMVALHLGHVTSAINGGDGELASGLDWIHTWALQIAENDSDSECSNMAMACLHVHSELILQAFRQVGPQRMIGGRNVSYKGVNFDVVLP